mgnify:CR=1 FL=1
MNEIMNHIHLAIKDFYIKYGCNPYFVYVGKSQIDCIQLYIKKHGDSRDVTGKDQLAGLELIVVDCDNHLNVTGKTYNLKISYPL